MQIIPHTFNRYELNDEELRAGQALTISNKAVIQNLIATIAEQKLQLVLDPQNITDFAMQEAFLRGQIDILQHLLDLSQISLIPFSGE